MRNRSFWIVLCIVTLAAAAWLYKLIDSEWAREHGMSILITIAFFICAASAVIFAFNAVDAHQNVSKE